MSTTIVVNQTLIRSVEETSPLEVVVEARPVTVEVVSGTPLSADIAAALNAAAAPSATNAFATLADVTAASAADLAAHVAAADPHGDRAYAAGLAVNYDAAGAASTAVANHVSATDPHGDRAYADAQIGQHANDSGAHRNYARIMMMGV